MPSSSASLKVRMANGCVKQANGCWVWQGSKTPSGYGRIQIAGRNCYAHRVALELARGPIAPGNCACHHCDNPSCVNPKHLFEGSPADNTRDRDQKGRGAHQRAGWFPARKLTLDQATHIRVILKLDVLSQRQIASLFDTSEGSISMLKHNKTWYK